MRTTFRNVGEPGTASHISLEVVVEVDDRLVQCLIERIERWPNCSATLIVLRNTAKNSTINFSESREWALPLK